MEMTRVTLCRLWSRQRQAFITVRVLFAVEERDGCRVFRLRQVDDLD